jgi:hypothetical protein
MPIAIETSARRARRKTAPNTSRRQWRSPRRLQGSSFATITNDPIQGSWESGKQRASGYRDLADGTAGGAEKGEMMKRLCDLGNFIRNFRWQARFGELSRAPLCLLRLVGASAGCVGRRFAPKCGRAQRLTAGIKRRDCCTRLIVQCVAQSQHGGFSSLPPISGR